MRHSRSERAGDLKASNITPPLGWTSMSSRLMLPRSTQGLGFVWYVLKFVDLFGGTCQLETGLTAVAGLLYGVELDLQVFEADTKVGQLGIEVVVVVHLAGESPVIVDDQ